MALDAAAVEQFTQGRLNHEDAETQRQLDAALAAARRYCGWHVTPVVTETVTLDGTGGRLLALPTLRLVSIESLNENGETVDPETLEWSTRGLVLKAGAWTDRLSGITATIEHGFDEAADFDSAVLSSIERGGFSSDAVPTVIGPFQYADTPASGLFSAAEVSILDRYALEKL